MSILPWKTMGRQQLSSKGQPGAVSGDPRVLCVTSQGISPQHVWYKYMYLWSTHIYHDRGVQKGTSTPSIIPTVLLRFIC